jgi:hypothetical protein
MHRTLVLCCVVLVPVCRAAPVPLVVYAQVGTVRGHCQGITLLSRRPQILCLVLHQQTRGVQAGMRPLPVYNVAQDTDQAHLLAARVQPPFTLHWMVPVWLAHSRGVHP